MKNRLILILLLCFPNFVIANTDQAVFHEGPSTEDVETRLESEIIDILDVIEKPSMDVEIQPEPPAIDFLSPNYLEMVRYRMSIALIERAKREGKPEDFYLNIFNKAWEKEHADNKAKALRAVRSSLCPEGKFYVADFPDGSPLCDDFGDLQGMENAQFSCAKNVSDHTIALDYYRRLHGKSGFPIYDYWTYYPQPPLHECKMGSIWGANEFCNIYPDYQTAGINHYACGLSLFQLQQAINEEMQEILPPCMIVGDFKDGGGGNLWKPIADNGVGSAVLLSNAYKNKVVGPLKILNANFREIGSGFYRGLSNPNRPTFRTNKRGADYGEGPIYVEYSVEGVNECRKVYNPANRED